MTNRRLMTMMIAMMLAVFVPVIAHAQPDATAPAAVVNEPASDVPAVGTDGTTTVVTPPPAADPVEEEITPEKIGEQFRKVIKDWRVLGLLAGLAALVSLLILVLKYKPINKLFERLQIKWIKPLIASVLGGISTGIAAYMVDGDVVNAIIAGAVLIGSAAVGIFETANKLKARNRDKGKNGKPA